MVDCYATALRILGETEKVAWQSTEGQALELGWQRDNLTDIGRFTAGVDMNNDKSLQPTYSIRGVETNDWTIGSDPAVARKPTLQT